MNQPPSGLKMNAPMGSLPVLQYCTPDQLRVDMSYQRSLEAGASKALIRRIATGWDWSLCQPLVVAKREDGGLYVVDGQHRLEAARLRGDIPQLPCVITQYSTAGEEAASFVALNQTRRPLSSLDLFKAALAAEDEAAVAVTRLMHDVGLSVASHTNYTAWKPGMCSNAAGILKSYRQHGETITQKSLSCLAAAFEGQILRYAGSIFPGIVGVIARDRTLDLPTLIDVLKTKGQVGWRTAIARHRVANPSNPYGKASAAVMRAALDERMGIERSAKPRAAAKQENAPTPAVVLPSGQKSWCIQCERRVDLAFAAVCKSPFCKLKRVVAA